MAKAMKAGSTGVLELTSDIVASYVSNNSVPQGDLAGLINSVHAALSGTMNGKGATEETQALKPPVPISKTVRHEYIISLEDGRQYRTLRRHLNKRGLTPEQYRAKWGLRPDYPWLPSFSEKRSQLAKASGLGQKAGRRRRRAAKRPSASPARAVSGPRLRRRASSRP